MPGYHRLKLPPDYRALLTLDARGFAWEWLRRNADFRATWEAAADAGPRAAAKADAAVRSSARPLVELPQHPLARRWSPWGLTFRPGA